MLLYPFLDKIAPIVVLVHLLFLFALGTVGHQLLVLLPGRVLRRKCFRERPPGDVALSADVNTSACEQFLLRKLLEQLRAFVSRRDVPDALPRKRRAGRKVFLNKTAQQKEAKRGGSSDVCKKKIDKFAGYFRTLEFVPFARCSTARERSKPRCSLRVSDRGGLLRLLLEHTSRNIWPLCRHLSFFYKCGRSSKDNLLMRIGSI